MPRCVHWQQCSKGGFERADEWYEQQPVAAIENEKFKLLWDFTIQRHRVLRQGDQILCLWTRRTKQVKITDFAMLGDSRVR